MKNSIELAAENITSHNVQLRSFLLRLIDPDDLGHSINTEVKDLIMLALNRPREYVEIQSNKSFAPFDQRAKEIGANAEQIAGNHYKNKTVQPWDYIAANELGYFEGNIVKYVSRWRDKGGVDDLKKARHYLDKLIELQ